jgi:hypothetical protein
MAVFKGFPAGIGAGADWTTIDGDGSLRTAAWADGGVNDICPVGFSVPTKEELKKDTVDTLKVATRVAPRFLSSQTLPV